MPTESREVDSVEKAREVMQSVSDALVKGDDASALRILNSGVGALLRCDTLPEVASEFDSRTRSVALTYVEEIALKAQDLEKTRRKLLLDLCDGVKRVRSEQEIDQLFKEKRELIVTTNVLEHARNLADTAQDVAVKNFLSTIAQRIEQEVEAAVFGDSALTLRHILASPDPITTLHQSLELSSEIRPQLYDLALLTRQNLDDASPENQHVDLVALREILDEIIQVLKPSS